MPHGCRKGAQGGAGVLLVAMGQDVALCPVVLWYEEARFHVLVLPEQREQEEREETGHLQRTQRGAVLCSRRQAWRPEA